MADKPANPGFEFTVDYLKKSAGASFAEVRDAAAKRKMVIYPIMYGRVQALLGIVKAKPRGARKAAKAAAAAAVAVAAPTLGAPVKRGPGRPRKVVAAPAADFSSLEGIVAAIKQSEAAKARYRGALERISSILTGALS